MIFNEFHEELPVPVHRKSNKQVLTWMETQPGASHGPQPDYCICWKSKNCTCNSIFPFKIIIVDFSEIQKNKLLYCQVRVFIVYLAN